MLTKHVAAKIDGQASQAVTLIAGGVLDCCNSAEEVESDDLSDLIPGEQVAEQVIADGRDYLVPADRTVPVIVIGYAQN